MCTRKEMIPNQTKSQQYLLLTMVFKRKKWNIPDDVCISNTPSKLLLICEENSTYVTGVMYTSVFLTNAVHHLKGLSYYMQYS